MKKLMQADVNKIAEKVEAIKATKTQLDEFIKEVNSLPTGKIIDSTETLYSLLVNTREVFGKLIMAKMPDTEYGLPVDKEARLRQLNLPDFSKIMTMAEELNVSAGRAGVNYMAGIYEMDGQEKVKINNEAKEKFLDTFRNYAENAAEEKFMERHKDFISAYHAFKEQSEKFYGEHNTKFLFTSEHFDLKKFLNETDGTPNIELFRSVKELLKVSSN